jgi:cyanophycinase-like exopeptidase
VTVCLQGGGEFSVGCAPMDRALLALTDGPIVVTALAGEVGRDYLTASENGRRHLRALGAQDVTVPPVVREQPVEALRALRAARCIVLPGGSPSRLLTALTVTPVGLILKELLDAGGVVMGASAGAMVLCEWTVLPDRRGPAAGPLVTRGLGIVGGALVVPHWSGGSSRGEWLRAVRDQVPDPLEVLGLPEESGLLITDTVTAVGQSATRLVTHERDLEPGQVWAGRLPLIPRSAP